MSSENERERTLEQAVRCGFFVGLPELESDPVRVVPDDEGSAPAGAEVPMTENELRRVRALARRLGLEEGEVVRRATLLGLDLLRRLPNPDWAAILEAAEAPLGIARTETKP